MKRISKYAYETSNEIESEKIRQNSTGIESRVSVTRGEKSTDELSETSTRRRPANWFKIYCHLLFLIHIFVREKKNLFIFQCYHRKFHKDANIESNLWGDGTIYRYRYLDTIAFFTIAIAFFEVIFGSQKLQLNFKKWN